MKPNLNQHEEADRLKNQPIYGFDRVTIYIDFAELPIAERLLKKYCTKVEVRLLQMAYNAKWKLKIEIFQPTLRCLQLLSNALGHNIAALVNYVEVAVDMPSANAEQACARRNLFLASAKMHYKSHPVKLSEHGTIFYFGPRYRWNGKKKVRQTRVIAIYADRPSKLLNARPSDDDLPCAHIECRVSGSAAMAEIGIVSIADLIAFNHFAFWEKSIRLYQLPERKVLGYRLAEAEGGYLNVTDAAFRKRAAKWVSDFSIQDAYGCNFIMHNAIRDNPEICKLFKPQSFAAWIDDAQRL